MSALVSALFSTASEGVLLVATKDQDDVVRVRHYAPVPDTEREIPPERLGGWLRSVRIAGGLATMRRVREVGGLG